MRRTLIFQSTHPSGVRLILMTPDMRSRNPRVVAPHWGATFFAPPPSYANKYFNPRTPVGCDDAGVAVEEHLRISIHAPQWGATCSQCIHVRAFGISIHAPQWGATCIVIAINHGTTNFNPRTPVGCDQMPRRQRQSAWNFNPRTPVGCDPFEWVPNLEGSVFQSTHPSGVRLAVVAVIALLVIFQATHPSGVRRTSARTLSTPR